MYKEESKSERSPELHILNSTLANEVSRMEELTGILKDKLNRIHGWSEPENKSEAKLNDPKDLISEISARLSRLNDLNLRLEHIDRHLSQII